MTDIFFDTDRLSAFLWTHSENILSQLYAGHIFLPAQVYDELKIVPHLLERANAMKDNGELTVKSMEAGSTEYHDYLRMTSKPETGMRIIGRGEAAGIAMTKKRDGILASNNLRDILPYVTKYKLKHITTGDILIRAIDAKIISETETSSLWTAMSRKRRRLPAATFEDYLEIRRDK